MSDNPRKKRLRILSTALNLERIPLIGFGTYAVKTPQVIYNALSVGYRHLDLAENYNNLQQIKQQQNLALAPLTKGGLGIEVNEIICLWEGLFPDDQNYFQLHHIMDLVSSIPLHGSMHAWSELFCEQALAKLIVYSPLGCNAAFILLEDTVMQSIAEKIGITTAQLTLAWLLSRRICVFPKSNNILRQKEYFASKDAIYDVIQGRQEDANSVRWLVWNDDDDDQHLLEK